MRELLIVMVSGLSGSGKSTVIKVFEDLGFYCVDNLPPPLIPKFADLCAHSGGEINRAALGIDVREGLFFEDLPASLASLKASGHKLEILYLEASEEVLVRRFSETRRRHPLAQTQAFSVLEGIKLEKERMADLRRQADRIVDTSELNVHQLRDAIISYYETLHNNRLMRVSLVSFGYKYGVPYNSDLVMDVRFLPNPHFVSKFRGYDGTTKEVREFLLNMQMAKDFLKNFCEFLRFVIPLYEREGKHYLTLALGCTGGKHRSVAVSIALQEFLQDQGYEVALRHRDLGKE